MINKTLDNRYTLLEHVGGGGMADVYRAHDRLLDRFVAVKILRPQFATDEQFVTRFRREAQAAAKLSHHNIVNIYDVGKEEDVHYIVMEYISGETLKDAIVREPLPVETAVSIAMGIAEGLEHAHQNHLVHCDIKPHNIIITRAGRIKVTDFGIAKAVTSGSMQHTGTIIGSVHYFSPEQAKGSAISAKSDIYSLGAVLYEMLTGRVPFDGETPIVVALQHLQQDPPSMRDVNPSIPPILEAIVLKAMAKEPEHRFKDISEMITDLKSVKNYLRDDQTRQLSREDFPTQVLPKIDDTMIVKTSVKKEAKAAAEVVVPSAAGNSRRKGIIAVLVLLLAVGFLAGAFMSYGKFWSSSDIKVANVVGKQVDIARNILTNQKLRVDVSEVFSEKVPAGHVVSQYPEADSMVKEQRMIMLVISKGGEVTTVPDLRGLSRREAELRLKNAGLALGRVDEQFNAETPADTVITQQPRPTVQVNRNTPIDLVISKGVGPNKVALPDFRGMNISAAGAQLETLKLKTGKITEETTDKYPSGTITVQNPMPAAEVAEGSVVDFTVTKAAAGVTSGKRTAVQLTVPEGAARQAVQIVVTDSSGRRIVYENIHKPGERVEKTIEGSGAMRIQVYCNGLLLQEQTI